MKKSKKIILLLSALCIGIFSCESPTDPNPSAVSQSLVGTTWMKTLLPEDLYRLGVPPTIDVESFDLSLVFIDDKSGAYNFEVRVQSISNSFTIDFSYVYSDGKGELIFSVKLPDGTTTKSHRPFSISGDTLTINLFSTDGSEFPVGLIRK